MVVCCKEGIRRPNENSGVDVYIIYWPCGGKSAVMIVFVRGRRTQRDGLMRGGMTMPPPKPRRCHEFTGRYISLHEIQDDRANLPMGCARINMLKYTHSLPNVPPTLLPVTLRQIRSRMRIGPCIAKNIVAAWSKPRHMAYMAHS